jgi:hypothetical protein
LVQHFRMPALTMFVDEAGDPGVRDGLHYLEGRHEWMCVSAVVVRTSRDAELVDWNRRLRDAANSTQAGSLHFAKIHRGRRLPVCTALAGLPCKAFTVASHKSNLREYTNPRLREMIKGGTFYNWCLRLLLERVTAWAADWQKENLGRVEPVRAIFGERGHDWEHFFAYVDRLEMQARTGTLFLKGPGLAPELLNRSDWTVERADRNAGVQLADVVASAFYQAANSSSPSHDPEPAKALSPIIPTRGGVARNVGVTVWPLSHQAPVPIDDRAIFEAYGYKFG